MGSRADPPITPADAHERAVRQPAPERGADAALERRRRRRRALVRGRVAGPAGPLAGAADRLLVRVPRPTGPPTRPLRRRRRRPLLVRADELSDLFEVAHELAVIALTIVGAQDRG